MTSTDRRRPHLLGRKSYKREELDNGKATIAIQLSVYRKLSRATASATEKTATRSMRSMICDSFMNNNGVLRGNNVIKYVPEQSVVKLKIGEAIRLTAEEFDRLARAFFAELERKFF